MRKTQLFTLETQFHVDFRSRHISEGSGTTGSPLVTDSPINAALPACLQSYLYISQKTVKGYKGLLTGRTLVFNRVSGCVNLH